MDKNSSSYSKQKTICEKFSIAIRTTSPFRPIRFGSTPPRDRCVRISNNNKESGVVPVIFETSTESSPLNQKGNHSNNSTRKIDQKAYVSPKIEPFPNVSSPNINQSKLKTTPIENATSVLPNRVPSMGDGEKSVAESIKGRRIQSFSNAGDRKPSLSRDSFNERVSDFINRAKYKFHNAQSFVEESGAKERRLK